jgi:cobalt-zinc-cadmium efflux system outer membrane protein
MVTALALFALALLGSGCGRRPAPAPWPKPRPLAVEYPSPARPAAGPATVAPAESGVPRDHPPQGSVAAGDGDREDDSQGEPTGDLALRDALALALRKSPSLVACAHEVAAAEARAAQSGLRRNPELEVRWDRLWPTGIENAPDDSRTRIILSQVLEWAPSRRRAVDHAESELAAWDCETQRLQTATGVARAFAGVLGAQEKLARLEEARKYVEEVRRGVVTRVASGEMPEQRLHQMTRHAAAADIALRRGEAELATARQMLAATWGGRVARFGTLVGRLEELPSLPETTAVRAAAEQSPAVARWQSEIARARAAAGLARAEAWPELRLDAGVRREEETGVYTYLLGFELPLPLFDRAQGDRRAARHDLAAATAHEAAARAETVAGAMTAYQDLAAAHFAARTLRENIIPAATAEFAALRKGYAENVVGVADLLDAARDFTRATLDYLDALVACHQALADLEGLTGQPLAAPANPPGEPSVPGESRR